MSNGNYALPIAVPPEGTDPLTFYGTFSGKISASWTPATALVVWLDASPDIARLHAPMKAAMRFVPTGTELHGAPAPADILILQTWPIDYARAKEELAGVIPSVIQIENVDRPAVRAAVSTLFTAIGRNEAAVDSFMTGDGLLKVGAGIDIGAAAPGSGAPSPATPNKVTIRLYDGEGQEANPVQFFSEAAEQAGIDGSAHPLLSLLDTQGWIELVITDAAGTPLAGEPFDLFFSDGTTRSGATDGDGRIFETSVPPGPWGLDLLNHPSFEIVSEGG